MCRLQTHALILYNCLTLHSLFDWAFIPSLHSLESAVLDHIVCVPEQAAEGYLHRLLLYSLWQVLLVHLVNSTAASNRTWSRHVCSNLCSYFLNLFWAFCLLWVRHRGNSKVDEKCLRVYDCMSCTCLHDTCSRKLFPVFQKCLVCCSPPPPFFFFFLASLRITEHYHHCAKQYNTGQEQTHPLSKLLTCWQLFMSNKQTNHFVSVFSRILCCRVTELPSMEVFFISWTLV